MIKTKKVIDKREAGYFSPSAHNFALIESKLGNKFTTPLIELTKTVMSGKWLPGTLYLTETALEFGLTPQSRSGFHRTDLVEWSIPLSEIDNISTRQGLAYPIVDVYEKSGDVKEVRCFRSREFIDAINKARANVNSPIAA